MNNVLKLLSEDKTNLQIEVSDWGLAVRLVAKPLLDCGDIKEEYIENCLNVAKDYGAYYVICPGVALVHSMPGENVNRVSISLLTLKNGVNFGHPDNDPVSLVLMFAATDNTSHMGLLSDIAKILYREELINRIMKATTYKEIVEIIEESQKEVL